MIYRYLAVLAAALVLAACGGGSTAPKPTANTGQLTLKLGDAPVDGATEVMIVFTGLELHSDGTTTTIDFSAPRQVDLLAYQNGATVNLLENQVVAAGAYQWMRLKVIAERNRNDGSFIKFADGSQYPLYVPSGAQTGLKLNRNFNVAVGSVTRLVADFDLRKSVLAPRGQDPNYVLKPVLRLMDELQLGRLAGSVNLRALAAVQLGDAAPITDCKAGLYLFAGGSATPDDMDGDAADGVDPVVYRPVAWDGINDSTAWEIAMVEAGEYTLAATCQFDKDVADANDYNPSANEGQPGYQTMKWSTKTGVVVTANQTTSVDLP